MKSHKKLKSRKRLTDKRASVRELHETKMKDFEEYYKTLPEKKLELNKLKNELESLKGFTTTDTRIKDSYTIKQDIRELEKEIYNMENQTDMMQYLLNVQNVFLKISENETKEPENSIEKNLKDKISAGIKKYINVKENNNVSKLVNEYVNLSNNIFHIDSSDEKFDSGFFNCDKCACVMTTNNAECLLVCEKCGLTKHWQDPDISHWSDECDFSKTYTYKKLGYFIEHLYRMQARECTAIPDFVINNVMMELKKNRVTSNEKINKKNIRTILKSLDMTNYYDNINSIIRTISGKAAPKFPEDLEDKLICMFMRTLQPFEKYKSLIPSRNNYLSYPYAIRKLLEIVAHEDKNPEILEFREFFGLLKSREKTWEHEKVWKKICEENEWPFIPSI